MSNRKKDISNGKILKLDFYYDINYIKSDLLLQKNKSVLKKYSKWQKNVK